jgi:hypothetical protein
MSLTEEWTTFLHRDNYGAGKSVLLSHDTTVGVPSHDVVSNAFGKLGRIDLIDSYVNSALGKNTKKSGRHIYSSESYSTNTILGAMSVARGWISNQSFWEGSFFAGDPVRRKVFVTFYGEAARHGDNPAYSDYSRSEAFRSFDTSMYNAANLWLNDSSDEIPAELVIPIADALDTTIYSQNYKAWIHKATRNGVAPIDLARAAKSIGPFRNFSSSLHTVVDAVANAESASGVTMSRTEFAEWLLIATHLVHSTHEQDVVMTDYITDMVRDGITATDLRPVLYSGVPLSSLAGVIKNDIDLALIAAL